MANEYELVLNYAVRLYDYTREKQLAQIGRWREEILRTALALHDAASKYKTALKKADKELNEQSWFAALFWTAFQLALPIGIAWLGAGAKHSMSSAISRSKSMNDQLRVGRARIGVSSVVTSNRIPLERIDAQYFFGDLASVFKDTVKDYSKMAGKKIEPSHGSVPSVPTAALSLDPFKLDRELMLALQTHENEVREFYVKFKEDILNPFWAIKILAESGGDVFAAGRKVFTDLTKATDDLMKTAVFGAIPPSVDRWSTTRIFERQLWALWVVGNERYLNPRLTIYGMGGERPLDVKTTFPRKVAERFIDLHVMLGDLRSQNTLYQRVAAGKKAGARVAVPTMADVGGSLDWSEFQALLTWAKGYKEQIRFPLRKFKFDPPRL